MNGNYLLNYLFIMMKTDHHNDYDNNDYCYNNDDYEQDD